MMAPVHSPSPSLVVSIVSHGHGSCVQALLTAIGKHSAGIVTRVVLTLNVPEPEPQAPLSGWPFVLDVKHNLAPLGFGANHNNALRNAREQFVCVLNPDVQFATADPFAPLVEMAALPEVGCSYPEQVDGSGRLQDFERELPSPWALLRRRMFHRQDSRVDWVSGACMVFSSRVWDTLGGFDERYFLYCEDVDLCLRLRLAGLKLAKAPASIVHAGQRASRRNAQHLLWHVRSLFRLWRSPAYGRVQELRGAQAVVITGTIDAP